MCALLAFVVWVAVVWVGLVAAVRMAGRAAAAAAGATPATMVAKDAPRRTTNHPERGELVTLFPALNMY
jgi:hypothetical protein